MLRPALLPEEIGLLFRPIVLQVSRWDRLKGWRPLLDGFVRLKRTLALRARCAERDRRMLLQARLVLAGPAPASIRDDPEEGGLHRAAARQQRSEPARRLMSLLALR